MGFQRFYLIAGAFLCKIGWRGVRGELPPGSARGCGDSSSKRKPDPGSRRSPGGNSPLGWWGRKEWGVTAGRKFIVGLCNV